MFDASNRDDGVSNLVGPRIPCGGSIQIDLLFILVLALSLRLLTETKSFFFIVEVYVGFYVQTGEGTAGATGKLEVQVVGGALLHSKAGGDGYIDNADKMTKVRTSGGETCLESTCVFEHCYEMKVQFQISLGTYKAPIGNCF